MVLKTNAQFFGYNLITQYILHTENTRPEVQFNQTCLGQFGEGVWREVAKPWTVVDYYVGFGPLSTCFLGVKPVYTESGVHICQLSLHQGVD